MRIYLDNITIVYSVTFVPQSYLFLWTTCFEWQEFIEEPFGDAPTSDVKERCGGAGGWCPPSSLVTDPLKRDWDLPGTQFDNAVPLLEVPRAEEDITFTSELVELDPFW